MSIVREMRERQTMTAAPERSGLGGTALIGCAVLAIAALAVAGWTMWPHTQLPASATIAEKAAPKASPAPAASQPTPTFTGNRLGQADMAPLVQLCVKEDILDNSSPVGNFMTINRQTYATAFAASIDPYRKRTTAELAAFWNSAASCMFQTSAWDPCDIDNRQFAVTTIAASLRVTARLESEPKTPESQKVLATAPQTRQKVLNGLRTSAHNGYLIAADFGSTPPADVKAIFTETKPVANRCPKNTSRPATIIH